MLGGRRGGDMKNLAGVILLVGLTALFGCSNAEVRAVRSMPINHIDLLQVKDGDYSGGYAYGAKDNRERERPCQLKFSWVLQRVAARHRKLPR
jgi:hypothetical protein